VHGPLLPRTYQPIAQEAARYALVEGQGHSATTVAHFERFACGLRRLVHLLFDARVPALDIEDIVQQNRVPWRDCLACQSTVEDDVVQQTLEHILQQTCFDLYWMPRV
jgi:hypothetical protein